MAENYGMLNNIASGIKEGLITYQTLNNYKREQQMMNVLHGVQIDPETGQAGYTPEKQAQLDQQKKMGLLQMQGAQRTAAEQEKEYAVMTPEERASYKKNFGVDVPEGYSLHQFKNIEPLAVAKIRGDALANATQGKIDNPVVQERLNLQKERVHNQNLKDLTEDTVAKQLVNTYNNLNNARTVFQSGGQTPQEFAELQQAVRSNLGIKGQSGIAEREGTYIKSLGLNADKIQQFLTGNPRDVSMRDPELVKQVLTVVDLEQDNKRKQALQQIMKKANAHKSFYSSESNAERAKDFNSSVDAQLAQLGIDRNGDPIAERGSGFIKQPPQGPAQAKGSAEHPQDSAAIQWARANPKDPRSRKILDANGESQVGFLQGLLNPGGG